MLPRGIHNSSLSNEPLVRSALTRAKHGWQDHSNWCTISWSKEPSKRYLQVRGHDLLPEGINGHVHVACSTIDSHSSRSWNRTVVVAAFRLCRAPQENDECPSTVGTACSTQRPRQGETRKSGLTVTLYLNELLIKYVNSKVDRSAFSHNGFPPVGPWHLVGATMDNTLD